VEGNHFHSESISITKNVEKLDWGNIYHHSDGMVVGAVSISVNLWSVQMLSDTESLHIWIGQLKIAVRPGNTSPSSQRILLFACPDSIAEILLVRI
jgi:hypothetical protein